MRTLFNIFTSAYFEKVPVLYGLDIYQPILLLDCERSDECIEFTMICFYLFFFYIYFLFLCLSSRFGAVKVLRFLNSAPFLIGK
ncbi:Uncharacterized protein FWK35_00010700 [Aphis craccivora]|uniref:Uncharacterized protein n=1 Tax=Aphis craccivora TaxID=307492 RepID=A0A6G0YTH1_APHCR|nr:Uncharacterized protein FWK35_00010700 [Aphis craccivora]